MSPDNLAQRLELKLVKFQNVERLCIFVEGNQDECETSAISGVWPVEGTRRGVAHKARVARADTRGHRAGSVAWRPPTASGTHGSLCVRPAGLKLWGAPIFTTNIKDFKRVSGDKGE